METYNPPSTLLSTSLKLAALEGSLAQANSSLGRDFEQGALRVLAQASPSRSGKIALAQARDLCSCDNLK